MRKLNKARTNKVESEPGIDQQLDALTLEDRLNAHKDSELCHDCIDVKRHIKRQLRTMSEHEIKRNQTRLTFEPCDRCKMGGSPD